MMIAATIALGLAMQEPSVKASRDIVMTKDQAYLLMPVEVASGATASGLMWSADGNYLALRKTTFAGSKTQFVASLADPSSAFDNMKTDLMVYNRKAKTLVRAFGVAPGMGAITSVQWIGRSNAMILDAISTTETPEESLYYVTAAGASKRIATQSGGMFLQVVDEASSTVAFVSIGAGAPTLRLISGTGQVSSAITLPWEPNNGYWDHGNFYVIGWQRNGQNMKTISARFDPKTQQIVPVERALAVPAPPVKSTSMMEASNTKSSLMESSSEIDLPLPISNPIKMSLVTIMPTVGDEKDDLEIAVVSTDGGEVTMTQDRTAIAYVSQGVAMIRELLPVDKKLVLQARDLAERRAALSKAKQCALACLIFAADNDDSFPASAGWADAIYPYVKSRALLDGFNYVLNGENAVDFENPATTMLGFVDCPGGRVVAYIDGHATFIANPK